MSTWALQPPTWWPALFALPLSLWVARWWRRRAEADLAADLGRREHALIGRPVNAGLRATLAGSALALFALALLRPVVPGREAQLAPDVALCVDVSRSMAAADEAPTRFEKMRRQVRALLEGALGSRFLLVAFAGDAQVLAPLTADRDAVAWLLDELEPGAIGAGGTDLGAAIATAQGALERVDAVGDLLILTDGEDFGGAALAAAESASAAGHRVYAVGYGGVGGSKIVVEDEAGQQAFLQDAAGVDVVTRLDAAGLAAVAAAGGGARWSAAEPDALVARWRDELAPRAARRRLAAGEADVVQRFGWPLLAGVLLWMLRLCLPERRR